MNDAAANPTRMNRTVPADHDYGVAQRLLLSLTSVYRLISTFAGHQQRVANCHGLNGIRTTLPVASGASRQRSRTIFHYSARN